MAFWTVKYTPPTGPVIGPQDAAAFGISRIRRKRKSSATDALNFVLDGAPGDSVLPFLAYNPRTMRPSQAPTLTFYRNGVQWFEGVVTRPGARLSGNSESLTYECAGPWYWLEKTIFQQQWVSLNAAGGASATQTTTQSEVTLGQSLDGVKMNSGQVINEVLLYAQYAFQLAAFPTTVSVDHLPAAPPTATPFQIGTIAPNIIVPYSQVRDKSCADIIRLMLKFNPDCVAWCDYSTTAPTINIGRRGDLPKKAITLFSPTTPGNLQLLTEFNPSPRYDLQVPVVVAKFLSHQSSDGDDYAVTTVDAYPPPPAGISAEVWNSQPEAWIQTIDLIGSHTTTQRADIVAKARPVAAGDIIATPWFLKKEAWLKQQFAGGSYLWDYGNIIVSYVNTVIDSDDPLNTNNPNNVPLPDCHTLVAELLTGTIDPWLQESQSLDAAKVLIEVWAKYTGSDAPTAALFTFDPSNPGTPTAPGMGYMVCFFTLKVTNADTDTYSEMTSASAGEPVPVGFAQYLFNSLQQLSFEGDLTCVEEECSDPLPPGYVFNVADGNNPDWKAMNALVLSVTEDIDSGTTSVTFGPPLMLGLRELEELFRANLGRLPSFKLNQRQDGKSAGGANVIGARHAADTSTTRPPAPPASFQSGPFTVKTRVNPADPTGLTFQAQVMETGIFLSSPTPSDTIAVSNLGAWFNLNANDTLWLEGPVVSYASDGTAAIKSFGNGDTSYNPAAAPFAKGGPVENDSATPPAQNVYRKTVAEFEADAHGKPSLKYQYTTTNLLMVNTQFAGQPAIYPRPL